MERKKAPLKTRVISALALVLLGIILVWGLISSRPQITSSHFMAMDTVMTVRAIGADEEVLSEIEQRVHELDELWSVNNDASVVSEINRQGFMDASMLDADTKSVVETAEQVFKATDGAFDIYIQPISRLWGFTTGDPKVPDAHEIEAARRCFGIDLGAIAKGYTAGEIARMLRDRGVSSAIISLGGNVYALGANANGEPWNVGIADPFNPSDTLMSVRVSDRAVVTSGGYQRFFEKDGIKYHHILDPKTGYPADSGLAQATIICADNTLADALSTAVFVMGEERAMKLYNSATFDFEMILVRNDGTIITTTGE